MTLSSNFGLLDLKTVGVRSVGDTVTVSVDMLPPVDVPLLPVLAAKSRPSSPSFSSFYPVRTVTVTPQLSVVGISSPSQLLPDVAVNPPRIALPPSEAPSYTRPAVTQSVSDMSAGSRISLLAAVVTQAATSIEPVAAPATDTGQRRISRYALPVASIQPAAALATNTGQCLSRRHATGSEDNTQALYPDIRHHVSALAAFCANNTGPH